MNPCPLLEALRQQGVEISLREGKLRWRARQGVLTPQLLHQMEKQREELIAELTCAGHSPPASDPPCPFVPVSVLAAPLPEWDGFEADAVLVRLHGLFDAVGRSTLTPSQVNVLAVLRQTAVDLHAKQDPLLFDMAGDGGLGTIFRRWGVPEEIVAKGNKGQMILVARNLRYR